MAQELFKGMATSQYFSAYLHYHLSTVNAVLEDWCEFLGTTSRAIGRIRSITAT
jgi:hypothetical protein